MGIFRTPAKGGMSNADNNGITGGERRSEIGDIDKI